ncbi:MAG: hypothetical protein AB1757_22045 [Acidobacteriota bacterium]
MESKEVCIQKYEAFKKEYGRIPKYKEFLEYAGFHSRGLIKIFGEDAYSKLQIACGDTANKLSLERTPREKIMRQYGDLVLELGKLPSSSTWIHRDLKPGIEGLAKEPHSIKWSDFPEKFEEWVKETKFKGYESVLELIKEAISKKKPRTEKIDQEFEELIKVIRLWSPARRRNSEGEYKIELRKHLESLEFSLNEEFGESNFDLLVKKKYAIEIKKAPNLSEYDRLFGQLARHLQHQPNIIALIMDAPSEDKFENFVLLVDTYLNQDSKLIEVVKK